MVFNEYFKILVFDRFKTHYKYFYMLKNIFPKIIICKGMTAKKL